MRTLTIKRNKSFVACLATMKVYIEDPCGDVTIVDTRCRQVGELKNGEEKNFTIDDTELKVFVIAVQASKNYCNDFYRIPAGEGPVCLSGKNVYNPAAGNPFRFDGVTDAAALLNRAQNKRKGLLILFPILVVGAVVGALLASTFIWKPKPKVFTVDEMRITLTDQFEAVALEGYAMCYDSRDVGVFVAKDELPEGYGNYTAEQYGRVMLELNGMAAAQIKSSGGLVYYEESYTSTETGDAYHYITYIYGSTGAFWMIQFATLEEDLSQYRDVITGWAKSVEFIE